MQVQVCADPQPKPVRRASATHSTRNCGDRLSVIPAKAGIQLSDQTRPFLDSRLRGNDNFAFVTSVVCFRDFSRATDRNDVPDKSHLAIPHHVRRTSKSVEIRVEPTDLEVHRTAESTSVGRVRNVHLTRPWRYTTRVAVRRRHQLFAEAHRPAAFAVIGESLKAVETSGRSGVRILWFSA